MPQSIFDLATQYAFAGYAALSPLLVAALFWRGSTRWGALASTLWTAAGGGRRRLDPADDSASAARRGRVRCGPRSASTWSRRTSAGALVMGFLPVVPMTLVSALLMVVVSKLTAGAIPGRETLSRYFELHSDNASPDAQPLVPST